MRRLLFTLAIIFLFSSPCLAAPAKNAAPNSQAEAAGKGDAAKIQAYSGNVSSKKFHNSTCRHFSCPKCTTRFASAAEAVLNGYIPCQVCGGR